MAGAAHGMGGGLEVAGLTRRFEGKAAVDGVSFEMGEER